MNDNQITESSEAGSSKEVGAKKLMSEQRNELIYIIQGLIVHKNDYKKPEYFLAKLLDSVC